MAQPNFRQLANALITAADQCLLIPNMPAVDQGQILTDLVREFRVFRTEVHQRFDGVDQRLNRIDDRLSAR